LNLTRAITIAAEAHHDQVDKADAPYILHPLRVMLAQTTDEARIVAVLHDVVEDNEDWTFERLASEGFGDDILEAIRRVTKNDREDYEDFARRAAGHPLSRAVKIADLEDNMDLSRLPNVSEKDRERIEKYRRALAILRS
jgi:(p)ppGpp synthase/HD superfamily hydrolase